MSKTLRIIDNCSNHKKFWEIVRIYEAWHCTQSLYAGKGMLMYNTLHNLSFYPYPTEFSVAAPAINMIYLPVVVIWSNYPPNCENPCGLIRWILNTASACLGDKLYTCIREGKLVSHMTVENYDVLKLVMAHRIIIDMGGVWYAEKKEQIEILKTVRSSMDGPRLDSAILKFKLAE